MKGLFSFLFKSLWVVGICIAILPKVIPDPQAPQAGRYKADFFNESGSRLGTFDLYFPESPSPNEVTPESDLIGSVFRNPPVSGWISVETQGEEKYFPVKCSASMDKRMLGIWKTMYLKVDAGNGYHWVGSADGNTFSGDLVSGGSFTFRRLGDYNHKLVDARAWESIRKTQERLAEAAKKENTRDKSSPSWSSKIGDALDAVAQWSGDAARATGEFLSDPEVQRGIAELMRFAIEAKFGQRSGNVEPGEQYGRYEPINPNQHTVRRVDGSTYTRTNPDGNPYNNFSSPLRP